MLHRFIVACSVLTLFAGLSAGLARADSVNTSTVATVDSYDFTYVPISGPTYTWSVANPVPATSPLTDISFVLTDVSYTVGGVAATGTLDFFSAAGGGAFVLAASPASTSYILSEYGPVLYQGPESNPTFIPGEFSLADSATGPTNATLTIAAVTSTATPEPSTLLMTGLGLVALFWVAGKRRLAAPVQ